MFQVDNNSDSLTIRDPLGGARVFISTIKEVRMLIVQLQCAEQEMQRWIEVKHAAELRRAKKGE